MNAAVSLFAAALQAELIRCDVLIDQAQCEAIVRACYERLDQLAARSAPSVARGHEYELDDQDERDPFTHDDYP